MEEIKQERKRDKKIELEERAHLVHFMMNFV